MLAGEVYTSGDKHIYVGRSRVATRLNLSGDASSSYEQVNTYYCHPDHLGSAQLVTDYQGGCRT